MSTAESSVSDLFITEIDAGRNSSVSVESQDLLSHVRKDHAKIQEVVNAFRSKVDLLVDKQRLEYIQAYEIHMQEVQKDLHAMREKVFEIANDDTKNERTEKLKHDLDNFKSEAIKLETEADELRVKMCLLVRKIYSVERSRDWMLKKLRSAKHKYNVLIKEKARVMELESNASLSNDGSFSVQLDPLGTQPAVKRLHEGLIATAIVERKFPDLRLKQKNPNPSTKTMPSGKNINLSPDLSFYPQIEQNPSDLSHLIAARSSREELKQFLSLCQSNLHKRPWKKVHRQTLTSLISQCKESCSTAHHDALIPLACELAATPEIYEILNETLDQYEVTRPVNSSVPCGLVDQTILNWSCDD